MPVEPNFISHRRDDAPGLARAVYDERPQTRHCSGRLVGGERHRVVQTEGGRTPQRPVGCVARRATPDTRP